MKPIRTINLICLLFICYPAHGQDGNANDVYAEMVLEEIIVTAQKIGQQSTLDVPVSITVLSSDVINMRHLSRSVFQVSHSTFHAHF